MARKGLRRTGNAASHRATKRRTRGGQLRHKGSSKAETVDDLLAHQLKRFWQSERGQKILVITRKHGEQAIEDWDESELRELEEAI